MAALESLLYHPGVRRHPAKPARLEGCWKGSSAATILLTCSAPGPPKGESLVPSLERMLEMVIGKKSLLAFLTSNWYGL